MLIACKSCHRQFDVGSMEQGEKVRCLCGELMTVPAPRSHVARIHHCSSCGGQLDDKASRCEYCGGEISLEERNLGAACPECFARLVKGARFCRECGVEIRPTAIQAKRLSSRCPRCKGELVHCTIPQGQYTECSGCGGLWLEESFFEKVVEERDSTPLGKMTPETGKASQVETRTHDVRYLSCPVCGNLMHRKNFATCSGVIIDWCKGHGFWFDAHELEKIIAFVNSGGMDKARENELARAKDEIRKIQSHKKALASASVGTATRPSHYHAPFGRSPLEDAISLLGSTLRQFFGR